MLFVSHSFWKVAQKGNQLWSKNGTFICDEILQTNTLGNRNLHVPDKNCNLGTLLEGTLMDENISTNSVK